MPDDWDFSTQRRAAPAPPIIAYGLCALCVVLTCAVWYADRSGESASVVTQIGRLLSPSPERIWDGAGYALFTSFFVHGDLMHLIFNMLWLAQLGRAMEAALPPWAYFLFLTAAAGVSMGCELAVTGHSGIGASGVVYAMFGLMWVGRARYASWREVATRNNLNVFLIWGVFCVVGTIAGFMHVANVAHGSGFLFGMAIGWLFVAPRRKSIWALPLAVMIALAVTSLFWLPWSAEWNYYRGDRAFEAKQYRAAIDWYHRSLRLGGSRYYSWENIRRAWNNIAIEASDRGDTQALEQARRQSASARALEGPDPALSQEPSARPGIHRVRPQP